MASPHAPNAHGNTQSVQSVQSVRDVSNAGTKSQAWSLAIACLLSLRNSANSPVQWDGAFEVSFVFVPGEARAAKDSDLGGHVAHVTARLRLRAEPFPVPGLLGTSGALAIPRVSRVPRQFPRPPVRPRPSPDPGGPAAAVPGRPAGSALGAGRPARQHQATKASE